MPRAQIKSLSIHNYRTISDCTLDYQRGAAALIGTNASGKTNIYRAIADFVKMMSLTSRGPNNQPGRQPRPDDPVNSLQWDAVEFDPTALLATPVEGTELEISMTAVIPPLATLGLPPALNIGLDDPSQPFDLTVSSRLRASLRPTGALGFVQTVDITIAGKQLVVGALNAVASLWPGFKLLCTGAHQPPRQSLHAMQQVRDNTVAGHKAFDSYNADIRSVDLDFRPLTFIKNEPTLIEADVSDLGLEKMASGHVQVAQILADIANPANADVFMIHIEEPETHLHPGLQRRFVRVLLDKCRQRQIALTIETHSAHVLAELFAQGIPVYRIEVAGRDRDTHTRRSAVHPLACPAEALSLLQTLGADGAFAILGGIVVVTDGPTDPPAYREFFSKFPELADLLVAFVPIGCLESSVLDLEGLSRLAGAVIVVADGHFASKSGDRLKAKCEASGIAYVQLSRWGVENFFDMDAWTAAARAAPTLKLASDLELDPARSIEEHAGIQNYSKTTHIPLLAKLTSRQHLEKQEDFAALKEALVLAAVSVAPSA